MSSKTVLNKKHILILVGIAGSILLVIAAIQLGLSFARSLREGDFSEFPAYQTDPPYAFGSSVEQTLGKTGVDYALPTVVPEGYALQGVFYDDYFNGYALSFCNGEQLFYITACTKQNAYDMRRSAIPAHTYWLYADGVFARCQISFQKQVLATWEQDGAYYAYNCSLENGLPDTIRSVICGMKKASALKDPDAVYRVRTDYPDEQTLFSALGLEHPFLDLSSMGYEKALFYDINTTTGVCEYRGQQGQSLTLYLSKDEAAWCPVFDPERIGAADASKPGVWYWENADKTEGFAYASTEDGYFMRFSLPADGAQAFVNDVVPLFEAQGLVPFAGDYDEYFYGKYLQPPEYPKGSFLISQYMAPRAS